LAVYGSTSASDTKEPAGAGADVASAEVGVT
jgi:hypothetical protein